MNARRAVGITFALTLLLVVACASWVLIHDRSESVTTIRPLEEKALPEQDAPRNANPTTVLPTEDVPGKEIPGLPRYPRSVRVGYERGEQEGLKIVRASYLTRDGLDAVHGFYRGIFRAEGWSVANAEFSEGEWTFLVVDGKREANVRIEPHGQDVTRADIELSEPLPKKETPKKPPRKQESRPAPQQSAPSQSATPVPYQSASPAPQSASPAPQSASPAPQWASPAPDDDYGEGGEDRDDFGDDGGGDD